MEGKTLVNVKKCFVINEKTNEKFDIGDTASEIQVEPILSAGKRDILRVKNKILGINETEDIVIGYKLKLKDNTFSLKVMQLVDGGTIAGGNYTSIPAGEVVQKDLFTLEVYTEEKDYSRTTGYTSFIWKHCKGKVPKYNIKDGDFIVPEFDAESIPFKGETSVAINSVTTIPEDTSTPTSPTVPTPPTPISPNGTTPGVTVGSDCKVTWTFVNAINQDDVTATNFIIKNKSDGTVVTGHVTIDSTKKIVTFIPVSIASGVTYTAEAKAVNLLDGSGTTTPISVDFTTV